MNPQTIAFFSNQICVRGTEVAMYDYAHYNETLLGNRSVIVYDQENPFNDHTAVEKFNRRFSVIPIRSGAYSGSRNPDGKKMSAVLDLVIQEHKIDAIYLIKGGSVSDGILPTKCKTLIHAVGSNVRESDVHGDRYAFCSDWLSQHCSGGKIPVVPHMVDLPNTDRDIRHELKIPRDAIVFGRSGGNDTFDIDWAKYVVAEVVNRRSNCYFLFQNTDKFYDHPRVIHLPMSSDMEFKTAFINSCDAMLHARVVGESFGISCGEFSIRNKPVITWYGSPERNHINILGELGIYYNTPDDLFNRLMTFERHDSSKDLNCYREYSPEKVMAKFKSVFLD